MAGKHLQLSSEHSYNARCACCSRRHRQTATTIILLFVNHCEVVRRRSHKLFYYYFPFDPMSMCIFACQILFASNSIFTVANTFYQISDDRRHWSESLICLGTSIKCNTRKTIAIFPVPMCVCFFFFLVLVVQTLSIPIFPFC